MKNLFIDTNIWLSLYDFTSNDLGEFLKLKEHIGDSVKLIIPKQIHHEIIRNRENKLKSSMKQFLLDIPRYPVFTKAYKEYKEISDKLIIIKSKFEEWKKKIEKDIASETLEADKILAEFFKAENMITCDDVIDLAYNRYKIGNPPGKDNKYGDAICWEALLKNVSVGEDLYIISADKDYRSIINDNKINPFLEKEWSEKKKSNIKFYTNLVNFLDEHVKDIILESEQEKQNLIKQLSRSSNFQSTHGVIAMLNKYSSWTDTQKEELCKCVLENDQVGWILNDIDVNEFYTRILSGLDMNSVEDPNIKKVNSMLEELKALT